MNTRLFSSIIPVPTPPFSLSPKSPCGFPNKNLPSPFDDRKRRGVETPEKGEIRKVKSGKLIAESVIVLEHQGKVSEINSAVSVEIARRAVERIIEKRVINLKHR